METHGYLWLLSVVTCCLGAGSGFNDTPDLDPGLYNLEWMKSIPDETPLSAISIPGTHESLTLYGGPLAVCQVWPLEEQLKVGVRYFDLHVGIWFPGQKEIYVRDGNWMFWQRRHLEEVVGEVSGFLQEHRSEVALLRVTLHGLYKDKLKHLVTVLMEKYKNMMWMKVSVPNLKETRGKMVLLQSETFKVGTENGESRLFQSNKLKGSDGKMERLKEQLCGGHIVRTETVASALRSPKTLARTVNLQLSKFLEEQGRRSTNRGCLGVMGLNFPSADLISQIVQLGPCDCGLPMREGEEKVPKSTQ